MPGLNITMAAARSGDALATFRAAQDRLVRSATESAAVDVAVGSSCVGHVAGAAYPIRAWSAPDLTVVLEGHIYDRSPDALERELVDLGRRALREPEPAAVVGPFVGGTDGDFMAVTVSADGTRLLVFGDAFGRLPIYLHQGPRGLVITRHARFVGALIGTWSYDRLGLAQQFWLGYALGERTIFEGIARAPHAPLVDARLAGDQLTVRRSSVYDYRCDRPARATDPRVAAAALADDLVVASERRARVAGDAPVIVSASGGNDSRTVMAALRRAGVDARAVSFERAGGGAAADVRTAAQVAATLGMPWSCVELPAANPDDEAELVWRKDGLNPIGMAFILPFLREVERRASDRAVLFTGDGGDKIFPDLRPLGRVRTIDDGVRAILADAEQLPARAAERIVGLPAGTLAGDLRSRLVAYPEPSVADKVVRFQIAERARKWLFEGEDRSRAYLWAVSPFYARSVVETALAVAHDAKADYRFYAMVQAALDPRLLRIPHADFGLTITSPRFRWRAVTRRAALRSAGPVIRRFRGRSAAAPAPAPARAAATADLAAAMDRAGSPLRAAVVADAGREAIGVASPVQLDAWRTVLLLERLWHERLEPAAGPSVVAAGR